MYHIEISILFDFLTQERWQKAVYILHCYSCHDKNIARKKAREIFQHFTATKVIIFLKL